MFLFEIPHLANTTQNEFMITNIFKTAQTINTLYIKNVNKRVMYDKNYIVQSILNKTFILPLP